MSNTLQRGHCEAPWRRGDWEPGRRSVAKLLTH